MSNIVKIGVPVLVGGGVAFLVWWLTRSDTAPMTAPAAPPSSEAAVTGRRILALRGYTQGSQFRGGPNLLSTLASQGLQQQIFRRGAY